MIGYKYQNDFFNTPVGKNGGASSLKVSMASRHLKIIKHFASSIQRVLISIPPDVFF